MKKIALLFIITAAIILTGTVSFSKENTKPYIILSSVKVNMPEENIRLERNFSVGKRIFYTVVIPKGIKDKGIRMQISKQDEKTSNWGFSIIMSKDFYPDRALNYFEDYFVLRQKGHYILQFFYLDNKRYPFAHTEFWAD